MKLCATEVAGLLETWKPSWDPHDTDLGLAKHIKAETGIDIEDTSTAETVLRELVAEHVG